jgi:hypothetical protein
MRVLWHAHCDRPKPFAIVRCRMRPHDAANVLLTLEYVVIVVSPFATGSAFAGGLEDEHGGVF